MRSQSIFDVRFIQTMAYVVVGGCAKPDEGDQTLWLHRGSFLFDLLVARHYLMRVAIAIVFLFSSENPIT